MLSGAAITLCDLSYTVKFMGPQPEILPNTALDMAQNLGTFMKFSAQKKIIL